MDSVVTRRSGSLASLREDNRRRPSTPCASMESPAAPSSHGSRRSPARRSRPSSVTCSRPGWPRSETVNPPARRMRVAPGDDLPQPLRRPRAGHRLRPPASARRRGRSLYRARGAVVRDGRRPFRRSGPGKGSRLRRSVLAEAGAERDRVLERGWACRRRSTGQRDPCRRPRSFPAGSAWTPRRRRATASGCPWRSRTTPTWGAGGAGLGRGQGKIEVAHQGLDGNRSRIDLGGTPQHGVGGTAGEIGHTLVAEGGPVCRCGNRGCLETLASSRAIADLLSSSRREEVSTRRLLELCADGDAAAQRLVGDAGRAIGIAVANLCNILNPECVIVGGDLSAAGEILLGPLREEARRNAIPRSRQLGDRPRRARRACRDAGGPGAGDARVGPFSGSQLMSEAA